MANQSALIGSNNTATLSTASTTTFSAWGGDTQGQTTEANQQVKTRVAGTMQNMRTRAATNGRAQASTVRDRKNTANGSLAITVTGSTTGNFSDTTHTTSYVAGDTWDWSTTTGSSTGNLILAGTTAEYVISGQAATQVCSSYSGDGGVAGNNTAGFYAICGVCFNAAEAAVQAPAMESSTISNLQMRVTTFTAVNSATGRSRIGGGNGNQTVTVNATGLFEDTTHTDSLTLGNLFNASLTSGASSTSIKLMACAMHYVGATAGTVPAYANDNGNPVAAGASAYGGLFGRPLETATESVVNTPAPFAGVGSLLTTNVSANASTTNLSLKWRNAGVNGNQAVAVTALTTGNFSDSTHSDSFAALDLITNQASGGTTGSVTFVTVGALIKGPVQFLQSVSATTTPVPSLVRATGKIASTTTTPLGSVVRATGKIISATTTPLGSVVRATARILSTTTTPVGSVVRATSRILSTTTTALASVGHAALHLLTLSASTTPVPSLSRQTAKALSTTTTPVPSLARAVGKIIGATTTPLGALSRQVGKIVAATTTPVPSVTAGTVYRVIINALSRSVASISATLIPKPPPFPPVPPAPPPSPPGSIQQSNLPPASTPVLNDDNTFTLPWRKALQNTVGSADQAVTQAELQVVADQAEQAETDAQEAITLANEALAATPEVDPIGLLAVSFLDGFITLPDIVAPGTNTKITYNAKGLVTAGTAAILASADFVNQGTTTTVLHGNAAGNPSWAQVDHALATNQSDAHTWAATQTFGISIVIADAQYYLYLAAFGPTINYDTNDFQYYDRTANTFYWYINNVQIASLTATTLTVANFAGNASTASSAAKWTTARTLSFTGDVTGSGSVDGSANVATALTLATTQGAVHTWSLAQTFTVAPVFTDQSGSRTALGLGSIATQASSNVTITGGSITGITDLAVADGGTGSSTASGARTNLGLGTAATQNTGTSGANVPLLNGVNTWAAANSFLEVNIDANFYLFIESFGPNLNFDAGDFNYYDRAGNVFYWFIGNTEVLHMGGNELAVAGWTKTSTTTVAGLGTATVGKRWFVTDATQTMTAGIGAVVVGGGANKVPVFGDGTNWRIG